MDLQQEVEALRREVAALRLQPTAQPPEDRLMEDMSGRLEAQQIFWRQKVKQLEQRLLEEKQETEQRLKQGRQETEERLWQERQDMEQKLTALTDSLEAEQTRRKREKKRRKRRETEKRAKKEREKKEKEERKKRRGKRKSGEELAGDEAGPEEGHEKGMVVTEESDEKRDEHMPEDDGQDSDCGLRREKGRRSGRSLRGETTPGGNTSFKVIY